MSLKILRLTTQANCCNLLFQLVYTWQKMDAGNESGIVNPFEIVRFFPTNRHWHQK